MAAYHLTPAASRDVFAIYIQSDDVFGPPIMTGTICVGIGGWTYESWRCVFYPDKLSQKKELEFASGKLTSIEHQCGVKHRG